jgi:hypothetical protein
MVLFVVVGVNIVLTLGRGQIAPRLAAGPQEVPRVSTSLAVTSFHIAIAGMSVLFTVMLAYQVLYANSSVVTDFGPVVALALFAAFWAQARYFSGAMARQVHRGWRIGAADGETVQLWEETFRARSWILALGMIGPVLVLLARVFLYGALGTVEEMPAGMLLE